MSHFILKYRRFLQPLIIPALLFSIYSPVHSQIQYGKDSVFLTGPNKIIFLFNNGASFFNDTLPRIDRTLVPSGFLKDEKQSVFLDSLKERASKHLITQKLYGLLIVTNEPLSKKEITESSEKNYLIYSGKKIRNIDIQRLNVFGSNLNSPQSFNPNKTEDLLNKTHLNTNEFIIRKNLLFSEGDTISPLILSDNERILRHLPFIDDSRIVVIPVSDDLVDIVVLTKDVYSLGASFEYNSIKKGRASLFDKNLLGMGHEFRLDVPYDSDLPDSPGFGIEYNIDNIAKSFINLNLLFFDGLGEKTYGFRLERNLVSTATKYAGGISVRQMFTTEDLDTLSLPEPLKYNLQDYWLARSILINKESVTRLIFGIRYTNNNVFDHPFILPDSYYHLQKYRIFLGSASLSIRRYYKTNLIYSYGRTEDIPYGGLLTLTAGKEINEFKKRLYSGLKLSIGQSYKRIGYFYISAGASTFLLENHTEQGILFLRTNFVSNLLYLSSFRIRNFVRVDYTRGFDRYTDEHLVYNRENGFSDFRNDSVNGAQRLSLSLESVIFSPVNYYGFRFAFFTFADLGYLFGTNEVVGNGEILSSLGIGIRIRNDNLVFNTFQIKLAFFPNLPPYSKVNYFSVSGETLLKPEGFDPGPPTVLTYR
ncbi:MAG: hypothetical protein MUC93_02480 [Bacteroidales bacterium]|jgi:hypothetical protein|nr:hypothetical protein [Bacteroidales bacterium]